MIDRPRQGIPTVVDTIAELEYCATRLRAGTGPVAVDAERASGHRYGQRAFLIQLNRAGAGIWLVDPETLDNLDPLIDALAGVDWILHAAIQDLPCLSSLGLWPDKLFDTELAGRLCGFPKVSLSALLERELGITLAKEHSAADWSQRPLTESMRSYAALDVEFLFELKEAMITELTAQGKLDYALEEFEDLRTRPLPPPKKDPWRKTSGIHRINDQRTLAVVKTLWLQREKTARSRDLPPGKLLPDSAIIAAAEAKPTTVPELLRNPKFKGRAAKRDATKWLAAIRQGLKDAKQPHKRPPLKVPSQNPPQPRQWSQRDPLAAARLYTAQKRLQRVADTQEIPMENLLTPSTLRKLCWRPPEPITPESIIRALKTLGARPWQIKLTSAIITVALLDPDNPEENT